MQILTKNPQQTISLGKKIAKSLKEGDILALFGDLGSGKTTFTKGIAEGLGIDKRSVNSPSFVLVKEYKGRIPFYHFDLYRIRNSIEIFNIGYEEYLSSGGIIAIEWADRVKDVLPKNYLRINFLFTPLEKVSEKKSSRNRENSLTGFNNHNERILKFIPYGLHYENMVRKICRS